MNHRERMALDEHIAGGHTTNYEVDLVCKANNCGHEMVGVGWSEYGASWFTPEECPDCNGPLEVVE